MHSTSESFPLPVFDEDSEIVDRDTAEIMWSLVFEAGLTLEEFREWWRTTGRIN